MKTVNTITIHPKSQEEENALKAFAKALKIDFEINKKEEYKTEFVKKVLESKQQIKEGKTKRIKKENINEFLGL